MHRTTCKNSCIMVITFAEFFLASLPANALPTPTFIPGQQDGVFITNGSSILSFQALDETQEAYHVTATYATPAGFVSATIYLTESGASTCTPLPGSSSLGDCSDGFTMFADPITSHLNVWFVSDGASTAELTEFFDNVSAFSVLTVRIPETGLYQDVSSYFSLVPGSAYVQSDVPEPGTLPLMGAALAAFAFGARKRKLTKLFLLSSSRVYRRCRSPV